MFDKCLVSNGLIKNMDLNSVEVDQINPEIMTKTGEKIANAELRRSPSFREIR